MSTKVNETTILQNLLNCETIKNSYTNVREELNYLIRGEMQSATQLQLQRKVEFAVSDESAFPLLVAIPVSDASIAQNHLFPCLGSSKSNPHSNTDTSIGSRDL